MKLLIGYDGSTCSDEALNDLQRAGLPVDVDALLLTAVEAWIPPDGLEESPPAVQASLKTLRETASNALNEARVAVERAAERVRASFPRWRVTAEACVDAPAWALIKKAEEWPAELVVVGSHGRSLLGRLALGSVAQRVLTELRCGVRVARSRVQAARGSVRLLIGFDGSNGARAALEWARVRDWPPGSHARIVTALDSGLFASAPFPGLPTPQLAEEWGRKLAEEAAATLRTANLEVSCVVERGDPKRLIVEEADSWEADCVFVGARGLSRMQRIVLGDVATAVAMRAGCSVEVVHRLSDVAAAG